MLHSGIIIFLKSEEGNALIKEAVKKTSEKGDFRRKKLLFNFLFRFGLQKVQKRPKNGSS